MTSELVSSLKDLSDRELLQQICRVSLSAFIMGAFPILNPGATYHHNWHVDAVAHCVQESLAGRGRRLLITQPPRSLKSISTSVCAVAWLLGRDPTKRVICASYSSELALDLSRQFRRLVTSPWYRDLFPNVVEERCTDVEFTTTLGGSRFSTSIGGTLTGRGGDILIVDDPLKADEAYSKSARDSVLHWFRNVLITRLNNQATGVIIVVMQRLHEDDLAGYLLATGSCRHLNLPAVAVEETCFNLGGGRQHVRRVGQVLHADRESLEILESIKRELGAANFSAQYQQAPVPPEGNLVKLSWIKRYSVLPSSRPRVVQSYDTASKGGIQSDYSAGTTWKVFGSDYYLVDVLRERLDYPSLRTKVIEQARKFWPDVILVEDTALGTALVQDLRNVRGVPRPIPVVPKGDKISRMAAQSACIEAGQLWLPHRAEWLGEFEAELLAFPRGRHDDQVDSLSQFLTWIRTPRELVGTIRVRGY